MSARSVSTIALLGLVGLSAPALAQDRVSPAHVLAGKDTAQRLAKIDRGFAGRTARISSIMGPELAGAAPLHVPSKPSWTRPLREADASVTR